MAILANISTEPENHPQAQGVPQGGADQGLSPGRSSYILKRLRTHGLIKKVAHAYKYDLTKLGRRILVTAMVIREYFVQPTLVRNAL